LNAFWTCSRSAGRISRISPRGNGVFSCGTFRDALYSKKNYQKLRLSLNTPGTTASIFIYEKTTVTFRFDTWNRDRLPGGCPVQYWNSFSGAPGCRSGTAGAGIRSPGARIRPASADLRGTCAAGLRAAGRRRAAARGCRAASRALRVRPSALLALRT